MRVKTKKEYIDTPALIIDLEKFEGNLRKMADYFRGVDSDIRPHIKTHKCPVMAIKQVNAGAIGITCAKVGEAEVMAKAGIGDILIANQVVGASKIMRLLDLLHLADVKVAVEDKANAAELNDGAKNRDKILKVIIEVDVGMGRCGVRSFEEAVGLAKEIEGMKNLELAGIMGYEGHIIFTFEKEERVRLGTGCMEALVDYKNGLEKEGFEVPIVSGGGTGTYDIASKVKGVTEVQAGSYLTMDVTYGYLNLGFGQALTILTSVISIHGDHVILDCGMKSVSSEFGQPHVVGIEGASVSSLSEEHGHMTFEGASKLKIGQKVELVPTHGCTTINLHDRFYVVKDDILEGVWEISARGKFV
ncbi:MAG: DSD1 family PLP-dependent enzyme [Deltaproteobacteria bacterium]|uniref:DSD1 family PLP-dependent enzyme n=1 Tax=Candidatus Zymogenus saltonus TaxID=2844893 RepID=A0A9D8KCM5_9DELT|nr:DSD1 family PLP-dependent enzyme [Candidatus Zymogenus saltonus]